MALRVCFRNKIMRVRIPSPVLIPCWWKWLYTLDLKSNAFGIMSSNLIRGTIGVTVRATHDDCKYVLVVNLFYRHLRIMEKKCPKCEFKKHSDAFRPNKYKKDGLQVYCRDCDDRLQHEWYLKNKGKVKAASSKRNKEQKIRNIHLVLSLLKGKGCEKCGEQNPIVLEFHHIEAKLYNVSVLVCNSWSEKKIKDEIDKCKILCANCHKIETAIQQNWYKLAMLNGSAAKMED